MPLKNPKPSTDEYVYRDPDSSVSHPPKEDESNWLVSYADMMTLLCGFFIMLFSMSKLDTPQYDSFREAIVRHFGGNYISPTKELAQFATEIIQEMGIEKAATVKSDSQGISIVFESTVFFETLSADISSKGRDILKKVISSIEERQKKNLKLYRIVIEGHTDSRPIVSGIYPSNWELSGARASRVIRLFLERGFPADHLTAIGYADTHPESPSRTPDGEWDEAALAKNRRVVLRILEPLVDSIPMPIDVAGAKALHNTQPSAVPSSSASTLPTASPVPRASPDKSTQK